ncbi:hypothetical protein E2C01_007806 [Portunus trituberculatus]|uniref:Uncharacterized protein n=1 Tax=Portunus trituberculatus TaxID=210409 RepID=A0A5B7D132_PORTR|nr:hypothetical protein [Portunus trituberculatus]
MLVLQGGPGGHTLPS